MGYIRTGVAPSMRAKFPSYFPSEYPAGIDPDRPAKV
jgi:hypothetical protein